MWLEQLLSRWCHDFGVTGLWSDKPRHDLRLDHLASYRRGRPPPLVGAWALTATGGRRHASRSNSRSTTRKPAREPGSARRSQLSKVASACRSRCRRRTTASHASSRPEFRLRSFASGRGCCAPLACGSTKHVDHDAATSTSSPSACMSGRQSPTPAGKPCSSHRTHSPHRALHGADGRPSRCEPLLPATAPPTTAQTRAQRSSRSSRRPTRCSPNTSSRRCATA